MTGTTTVPTDEAELRAHLLGQVDAIADTLAACADEAERAGRYRRRAWRALHDAGLFRMKAPRELGGARGRPDHADRAHREGRLHRHDRRLDDVRRRGHARHRERVAARRRDGDYLVDGRLPRTAGGVAATGTAVPVEGGYRVTGALGLRQRLPTTRNGWRATRSSARPTRRR